MKLPDWLIIANLDSIISEEEIFKEIKAFSSYGGHSDVRAVDFSKNGIQRLNKQFQRQQY